MKQQPTETKVKTGPKQWGVPVLLFLFGMLFLGMSVWFLWNGHASKQWPVVQGQIMFAEAVKHHSRQTGDANPVSHYAAVHYTYPVSEDPYAKRYFSDRLFFGYHIADGPKEAEAMVKPYAEGDFVNVYANPNNMRLAALIPGIHWLTVFSTLFPAVLFFAVGIHVAPKKQKKFGAAP